MAKGPTSSPVLRNKKATYRFEILEQLEAGIELRGAEVKSLRSGKGSLEEAYAVVRDNEAFLRGCHINPYENSSFDLPPVRDRKLLLHRREIRKLVAKVTQKGLTLVPLRLFFNERGLVKLQIGLCRGKKLHDKRESIKKRDQQRDMDRATRRGRSRL